MRARAIEFEIESASSATPDFNRLAPIYCWMEWLTFGPLLQRCRCAFLSTLARHRRALVLGDGDGRFTACLLQENCAVSVDAVDASQAMLRQLSGRSPASRVRTHVADARTFSPPRSDYDLIATHFFLDCLSSTEVRDLARRLRDHSSRNAVWVVSEFAIPSNLFGRIVAHPVISALYLAFGLLTNLEIRKLPDHRAALAQSGWSLARQHKRLAGLLVSELWQLGSEI